MGVAMQEATRIEIACSRGVDEISKLVGGDFPALITAEHDRSLSAAGEYGHAATTFDLFERALEVSCSVQRFDLILIGKEHIHMSVNKLKKAFTVTVDAEAIG